MPFSPMLAEYLDLYPVQGTEDPAPVLMYLHGGYWLSHTSKELGFTACGPASEGVAKDVASYALGPEATSDEIVGQLELT